MPKPRNRTRRAGTARTAGRSKTIRPESRLLTTMRLRESLRRELEATAARSRRSVADVTQELLDEALRMRQCPGIYFSNEPSGRTAKIGGSGLGVWEVVRDFSRNQNVDQLRKAFPQLSQAQVTAALMYYARYRNEVQVQIDANAALTPEAVEKEHPGLVRLTR